MLTKFFLFLHFERCHMIYTWPWFINRPSVAWTVLQSPLSLDDWLIELVILLYKIFKTLSIQIWKMSEILPEQDSSFQDFTQKCLNYVNLKITTKQRNLCTNKMFTTFTSLNNVYKIVTKKNTAQSYNTSHRSMLGLGEKSRKSCWVTLPRLGNLNQVG